MTIGPNDYIRVPLSTLGKETRSGCRGVRRDDRVTRYLEKKRRTRDVTRAQVGRTGWLAFGRHSGQVNVREASAGSEDAPCRG